MPDLDPSHFASPGPSRKPRLPEPAPEALEHSRRLTQAIRAEIGAAGGAIPFHRYMELALYAPGLGYYVAGSRRFGAEGDFITAPEMGSLFGRVLARALRPWLGADGVLELGAGSGALAAQLLTALADGEGPPPYAILETSADLVQRQQGRLADTEVRWLAALPPRWHGAIVLNEVLDALPVHLLELDEAGALRELGVGLADEGFRWARLPADEALRERLAPYAHTWPRPYRTEVNLAAEALLCELGGRLAPGGAIFVIDYGFGSGEYYHPARREGTLRCFYRHHAHGDPFFLPGLNDITASLDFGALMAAARAGGLEVLDYAPLARWLMGAGLMEMLGEIGELPAAERLGLNNEIKRLILPTEMGEAFKVLVLGKRA